MSAHNLCGCVGNVMFTSSQYRQMAEEAARLAEAATSEDNRVIWLKIAEGYQILAERAGLRPGEETDDDDPSG